MLGNWLKRSAPDWLTTVAFRAGLRVSPGLARRSSLAMCHVARRPIDLGLAPGYNIGTLAGPSAPPEWIDTLASAGVQVTPETWIADLVHPDAFAAVVRYEGQVAGTASLTPIKGTQPSVGLVTWVGIRKEHQGRGLGRPLVGACLDHARAAGMDTVLLVTDDHRLAAIKTYLAVGFRPCLGSWDWTHGPRWRGILAALGTRAEPCRDQAHAAAIARIG